MQLANYGRRLEGEPDALTGYTLEPVEIDDPAVVYLSGKAVHMIARRSRNPAEMIPGMVFVLTEAELAATDAYETDAYSRVEVTLRSGRTAWVYVGSRAEGDRREHAKRAPE